MQIFQRQPAPPLRPYIDRLWGWDCAAGAAAPTLLPTLLPGTGAELYFHYRRPFRHLGADGAAQACPQAHLLCLRGAPLELCPADELGFIAVRFRAGMLHRFTTAPAAELLDRPCDIEQLWGAAGRACAARVAGAANLAERLALVEAFLAAQWRAAAPDALVEAAVARLYRDGAGLSIARLADDCRLGRRQLERRFRALTGQTATQVRRLGRFQKTVRALLLDPAAATLDTALRHGYYDQAHFIHEFRRLAHSAPQRHLQLARGRTHFYNPPRGAAGILATP
jgi:AraC-like DNA-binding protein